MGDACINSNSVCALTTHSMGDACTNGNSICALMTHSMGNACTNGNSICALMTHSCDGLDDEASTRETDLERNCGSQTSVRGQECNLLTFERTYKQAFPRTSSGHPPSILSMQIFRLLRLLRLYSMYKRFDVRRRIRAALFRAGLAAPPGTEVE